MTRGLVAALALLMLSWAAAVGQPKGKGDKPFKHFIRFAKRDNVELVNTRGMLNPNAPFTVEAWYRLDPKAVGFANLMSDELWKGLTEDAPVDKNMGLVLRLMPVEDADKRAVSFVLAPADRDDWFAVASKPLPSAPGTWRHVAVCRGPGTLSIYLDGKLVATRDVRGATFRRSVSNLYLGCRKDGVADREFNGDLGGVRVSDRVRYGTGFKPQTQWAKDENTLLLLDFSKPEKDKVLDQSGKDHHGTLNGAKWQTEG